MKLIPLILIAAFIMAGVGGYLVGWVSGYGKCLKDSQVDTDRRPTKTISS